MAAHQRIGGNAVPAPPFAWGLGMFARATLALAAAGITAACGQMRQLFRCR